MSSGVEVGCDLRTAAPTEGNQEPEGAVSHTPDPMITTNQNKVIADGSRVFRCWNVGHLPVKKIRKVVVSILGNLEAVDDAFGFVKKIRRVVPEPPLRTSAEVTLADRKSVV